MSNIVGNSKYIDQIAEYVLAHYIKRQSNESEMRSIETRISNTKKQIDEYTTAFIEAKNSTLRDNIEAKITDCEKLLDYLKLQKYQLKLEQKARMTKLDAIAIVEKYLDVNEHEHTYRKQFIDATIKKVMCFDDGLVIYYDLVDCSDK